MKRGKSFFNPILTFSTEADILLDYLRFFLKISLLGIVSPISSSIAFPVGI
jgi:hypothetical protein